MVLRWWHTSILEGNEQPATRLPLALYTWQSVMLIVLLPFGSPVEESWGGSPSLLILRICHFISSLYSTKWGIWFYRWLLAPLTCVFNHQEFGFRLCPSILRVFPGLFFSLRSLYPNFLWAILMLWSNNLDFTCLTHFACVITLLVHICTHNSSKQDPLVFLCWKKNRSQETLRRNCRMLTCGKAVSDFWIWRKLKGLVFLSNFKILTNIGGVIENFPSLFPLEDMAHMGLSFEFWE